MKYFVLLCVFALGADAQLMKMKTYWNECLLEHGTTNDEMKDAIINKAGMHKIGCVVACLGEKLQVVGENGVILPEKVIKLFEQFTVEKGLHMSDAMREYIRDCAEDVNSSSSSDHCDRSMNFVLCLKAHVTAHVMS